MWTMHIHPECYRYEQSPSSPVDPDFYECMDEYAFPRDDALAYAATLNPPTSPKGDTPGESG
jgi:hypothetical protein